MAVVFDFDGVLCASMERHVEAYAQILEPLEVPVSQRAVFLLEGARSESIIRDLAGQAGRQFTDDQVRQLANDKQRAFAALQQPQLYPEAARIVKTMASKTTLGLVTGTRRSNLERLMPELIGSFKAIMSQSEYTHDKPHPEPYLNAAAALDADPADCVAVENAPRGVTSALEAGYRHVIAIGTTVTADDLAHADAFCADHQALLAHLEEIL